MRKAILCAVVVILACGLALGAVQEKVLHSFGGEPDGINPWAGLTIDASGNLYGTTGFGGNPGCFSDEGCGTVFQLVLNFDGSWTENVIYRFKGGADGDLPGPFGKLVLDDSENLYGTTQRGGDLACAAPNGCGTVFKLTPNGDGTWTQSVIYTFEGGPDGGSPGSVSFDNEGNLLGVAGGGTYNNGLIFELTPNQDGTWTKTTVYSFRGDPDGSFPGRLVLDKNGDFYGAAQDGGSKGALEAVEQFSN